MKTTLNIDFVSDVSCPWCAVGLGALELALQQIGNDIDATIRFQPFELNPAMPPEGQDIIEHLTQKYGSTEAQQAEIRDTICKRGADVGFEFNPAGRGRIWNTFDAHRLLYMADVEGQPGQQRALKKALLAACHTRSESMNDRSVLLSCAREAGLDEKRASELLLNDEFASEVEAQKQFYSDRGIKSVPAVVINNEHLISGGQPVDVFVQALRQIAQTQSDDNS